MNKKSHPLLEDTCLPFQIEGQDIKGRIVRLGHSVNEILSSHNYPNHISKLMGEVLAFTALIGSLMKYDGILTTQMKGDGPFRVLISDFHKENKDIEHEIVITPKMSFGTGHHETTFLMSNEIFNIKLTNLSILDMGSGTGVLSIISSKLGAKEVMAIDIDEWAYENSIENSILNNTNNINFFKGDVSLIRNKNFDCILANINRNIILRDLVTYYKSLIKGGKLLISGFLVEDFDIVNKKINEIGFKLINKKNKNKWLMLHLEK